MRPLLFVALFAACIVTTPPPASTPPPHNTGTGTAPSCAANGSPLYQESKSQIHPNPPPNQPPGQSITILDSGAWTVTGEGAGSGCLTGDELANVKMKLATPPVKKPPGGIHCDMMPNLHYTATYGGGTIDWDAPCVPGPDDASEHAIDCARDLTVRRAEPTGACAAPTSP